MDFLLISDYVFACDYDFIYNIKKTKISVFIPKSLSNLYIPHFTLDGKILPITKSEKYLGCFISDDLSDDRDIKRQTAAYYLRGNSVVRTFSHCSNVVLCFRESKMRFNLGLSTWYKANVFIVAS